MNRIHDCYASLYLRNEFPRNIWEMHEYRWLSKVETAYTSTGVHIEPFQKTKLRQNGVCK